MESILGGAVTSFNDTLTRAITGQKVNFSQFFFGLASEIAKIGLQAGEVNLAKMLGLGGTQPGSGGVLNTGVGAKTNDSTSSIWGGIGKIFSGYFIETKPLRQPALSFRFNSLEKQRTTQPI